MEDVAAGQANHLLQIPRTEDLLVEDDVPEVRDVFLDGVDDGLRERFAAVRPLAVANVYGAYWMKHDMMCFPGGARVGSTVDGMHMSMNGRWEKSPYFASSYAFSM